jgi:murein hydrolase activator
MKRLILFALLAALPAAAQTIADEARALEAAKREAVVAAKRAVKLEAEADQAADAADKARRQAAAAAAKIQAAEADISAARARMQLVERLRARQQIRLAEKQGPIVRLTAALQTLSRRPPALALVQRGSARDAVHVRAVLATTLPVIQEKTAGLRAELAASERLRKQALAAVALLRDGQTRLEQQRGELARLAARERARSGRLTDSALFEQDRAQALGEEARDIATLLTELDRQAGVQARLAKLPGPLLRPAQPGTTALPNLIPDFTSSPPDYQLPVLGRVTAGLGEISATGVRSKGVTLRAARDAQVVAPAAGRIMFAAPFRGYGRIVIVDHGGGYTTLITGLGSIAVQAGDRISQGGPLGRAAGGRGGVTVEVRRDGEPVDLAPLLGG